MVLRRNLRYRSWHAVGRIDPRADAQGTNIERFRNFSVRLPDDRRSAGSVRTTSVYFAGGYGDELYWWVWKTGAIIGARAVQLSISGIQNSSLTDGIVLHSSSDAVLIPVAWPSDRRPEVSDLISAVGDLGLTKYGILPYLERFTSGYQRTESEVLERIRENVGAAFINRLRRRDENASATVFLHCDAPILEPLDPLQNRTRPMTLLTSRHHRPHFAVADDHAKVGGPLLTRIQKAGPLETWVGITGRAVQLIYAEDAGINWESAVRRADQANTEFGPEFAAANERDARAIAPLLARFSRRPRVAPATVVDLDVFKVGRSVSLRQPQTRSGLSVHLYATGI